MPETTNPADSSADSSLDSAIQSVKRNLADRDASQHHANVDELHTALVNKDKDAVERVLDSLKREALWLYEELMQHPQIGIKMRELSIFGL